MLGRKTKTPGEQLDYDIKFERWLSEGDTILDASVTCDPPGDLSAIVVLDPLTVKAWVAGGVNGKTYEVKVTATTAQGRTKEQCFMLRVSEC